MAVTKMPLMSLDASGSVGKAITFSKWKGRHYVRSLVKPKNPKSGTQVGVRTTLKWMSQIWSSIGATAQANWKVLAKFKNVTPLNAAVRLNQRRGRQDLPPYLDPLIITATAEATPVGTAATAMPKSVKITWTDSTGAQDWGTALYMLAGGVVTPSPSTLIAMIKRGLQVYIVPKLTTGVVYHFATRGFSKDGTFSAASADVTGTPT
jgi:hypothetical protein